MTMTRTARMRWWTVACVALNLALVLWWLNLFPINLIFSAPRTRPFLPVTLNLRRPLLPFPSSSTSLSLSLSFSFGYFHEPVRTRTLKGALLSIIIIIERSQAIHNAIARLPVRLPYEPSDVEVLLFGNRDRYCPTIRYLPLRPANCVIFFDLGQ